MCSEQQRKSTKAQHRHIHYRTHSRLSDINKPRRDKIAPPNNYRDALFESFPPLKPKQFSCITKEYRLKDRKKRTKFRKQSVRKRVNPAAVASPVFSQATR